MSTAAPPTIADALAHKKVSNDPLYDAARAVERSDLPDESKTKLIEHISNARVKHPVKPYKREYDRGTKMANVAADVADACVDC